MGIVGDRLDAERHTTIRRIHAHEGPYRTRACSRRMVEASSQGGENLGSTRIRLVHGALRNDAALALEGRTKSEWHANPGRAAEVLHADCSVCESIQSWRRSRSSDRAATAWRRCLSGRAHLPVVSNSQAAAGKGIHLSLIHISEPTRLLST